MQPSRCLQRRSTTLVSSTTPREGANQDCKEAVAWCRKVAEQGSLHRRRMNLAQAQHNLGCLHAEGNGVSQGFVKALKWWQSAAGQGHEDAPKNLDLIQRRNLVLTPPPDGTTRHWSLADLCSWLRVQHQRPRSLAPSSHATLRMQWNVHKREAVHTATAQHDETCDVLRKKRKKETKK